MTDWAIRGCLLSLLLLALAGTATGDGKAEKVKLKKTTLDRVRLCAYGLEDVVAPETPIPVGVYEVRPTEGKREGELELRWQEPSGERIRKLKPKKAQQAFKIGSGRDKRTLLVGRDRVGRLRWMNPDAMRIRVAGREIVLVDHDFDQNWLEPGVDRYGLPDSPYLVPLTETIHLGSKRLRLVDSNAEKRTAAFEIDEPGPGLTDYARKLYGLLNDVRLTYGLQPTELDEAISAKYCQRHADWMARNKVDQHEEIPGSPLYSEEGHIGGTNSLVGYDSSWAVHFFGYFDTPLHGYEMASPYFTRVALAERDGYVAIWFTQAYGMTWPPTTARVPAVFPPNEATGIPISWWDEIPDPREGDPEVDWGYPIRIYVSERCGPTGPYPTDVSVSLRAETSKTPEPVQLVYDPATVQPHVAEKPQYVEFLVLPRRVLKRDTRYVFEAKWTYEGEHHWKSVFTTGSQRGTLRDRLEPGK